ncbi:hypothetical protein N7457_005876 [Penicillium paradoxum]|uniref:uncharacterized protein n=1 Tax=Penicillium paradoxum TaxID=176176 RepID=UPI002548972C|nr:uncharacterized protein N7457_005876 [Penicillium paradoxum]KAJ5780716.1 hypothetical protein N7457_005876 [Penicillium paradoxum]
MAAFKVIIVGGSIAGLVLANMLERYGIDYELLEKHDTIAPRLGAGYSLLPHGSRILDQLGCYNVLEKLSTPINTVSGYDEHGIRCANLPGYGEWMEKTLGYKMRFLERYQVVKALYDNLGDKSKVHTSCAISSIHSTDDGVRVETDGRVYEGDIVVGADGVHSYVRHEMDRLREASGSLGQENSFVCNYRAIFGTSVAPEGLVQEEAFKGHRSGRSYMCSPGLDGLIYWIAMFKNDEKTRGNSIPRYTARDRHELAARYADDIIKPGATFGELYQKAIATSLVSLEEGVLSCYHKRIVLVGDSWHKINPLTGQGGNTAISGAACLADELKNLLDRNDKPNKASIEETFARYRQAREIVTRQLVKGAHVMQQMEALETPLLRFIQLKLIRFVSVKMIANQLIEAFTSGIPLQHLPLPSRRGTVPIRRQLEVEPEGRTNIVSKLWVLLLPLIPMVYHFLLK